MATRRTGGASPRARKPPARRRADARGASRASSAPASSRKSPAHRADAAGASARSGRGRGGAPRGAKGAGAARAAGGAKAAKAGAYSLPAVWTKDAAARGARAGGFLHAAAGLVGGFFLLVGRGLGAAARGVARAARRSRAVLAALVVAGVLVAGGLADWGLNAGRVYAGVHVGDVDLSGKTADEARAAVEEAYAQPLSEGTVAVCADGALADAVRAQAGAPLAERAQVAEAQAQGTLWMADAASLGARLDAEGLVADALAVGREDGGLPARLQALVSGRSIAVRAVYDAAALESLAAGIDAAVGNPRVDFGVVVEEGVARVTEGHAGTMIDRDAFARELDAALLEDGGGVLVANLQHAPLRIDAESAQRTCDEVNAALARGARFGVAGFAWEAGPAEVGQWVTTRIEEAGASYVLAPCIDASLAAPAIQKQAMGFLRDGLPNVSFAREGDAIVAKTDGTGSMPLSEETARQFDEALFGPARARLLAAADGEAGEGASGADAGAPDAGAAAQDASSGAEGDAAAGGAQEEGPVVQEVAVQPTPTSLPFEEALESGLVEEISSYTTEYLNTEASANRRHNIHLAADKLNDSIVAADGGTWSFYGTAGECNEEAGFLGAGVIIAGEHDDAVGGGICQVTTTVFNAVYEAGFPVLRRYNHTLYLSNYPDGRDAAVNWPDLDLQWQNDCASDVLLRCSYTDTSLTVTLYGVDPGYQVETQTGQWQEGDAYKVKVKCDEHMAEGASYVEVSGVDGGGITVYRTVRGRDGSVLREDAFSSWYQPENKVVVAGPGTKVEVGGEVLVATPGKTVTSKGTHADPAPAAAPEALADAGGGAAGADAQAAAGTGDSAGAPADAAGAQDSGS